MKILHYAKRVNHAALHTCYYKSDTRIDIGIIAATAITLAAADAAGALFMLLFWLRHYHYYCCCCCLLMRVHCHTLTFSLMPILLCHYMGDADCFSRRFIYMIIFITPRHKELLDDATLLIRCVILLRCQTYCYPGATNAIMLRYATPYFFRYTPLR